MGEKKQEGAKGILFILALFIIGFLIYKFSLGTWTLMVCDEAMDNGVECYSISSTQELGSKEACMASGRALQQSYPVFECGRACDYDGNFWICKEICNMNGVCHN